ncbi:4-hydroxythreonine-4-phosphate dehydrogenase PdxA [Pragia fontium]|uniref:4-hydroxythreonine-4-phosphate dehydrogenase n=1 Tax=Pragia fontium DSM 5563 = ATCC 49100 TaxID=1122977 RepID=A0AAJ5BGS5_9GAMM|nr:4-hydroxythreonine-4-phosphate dehydrogenase PdxA [Pragia fontium]SFC61839.1 4-hydroxythreonine-4-phosphate dehydrogenase [Pragia fontium DSM 5563 = ATCC 49100]SUB83679.1 4-hydroxythreonine-4-phosphate dehydrogenase 2 [Pragia fontium]VEJ56584.1 4-hydroxythreonine-4-phosphate dehydrogenase 2 [Pragia fontium]
MNAKPLIGIPMGDPAGIGPEIVVKTVAAKEAHQYGRMIIVGDKRILEDAAKFSNVDIDINPIGDVNEAIYQDGTLNLIQCGELDYQAFKPGAIQGQCGKAAYEYIKVATELTLANQFDVLATTPINKESLKAGKVNYIGHTEILADLTGADDPLTMFQVKELRVFFLTRHLSLVKAIQTLTPERVCDYAIRCAEALHKLGIKDPKMAVAGINPHCGEHGLFGHEDDDVLLPGIEMAQKAGVNVVGPKPADSVFHFALLGAYDAVLSPYHDQGHIATKMVDFHRTISITNGMPILRTSVDHGTANDIAGKGIANAVSLIEAVRLAALYAPYFKK